MLFFTNLASNQRDVVPCCEFASLLYTTGLVPGTTYWSQPKSPDVMPSSNKNLHHIGFSWFLRTYNAIFSSDYRRYSLNEKTAVHYIRINVVSLWCRTMCYQFVADQQNNQLRRGDALNQFKLLLFQLLHGKKTVYR